MRGRSPAKRALPRPSTASDVGRPASPSKRDRLKVAQAEAKAQASAMMTDEAPVYVPAGAEAGVAVAVSSPESGQPVLNPLSPPDPEVLSLIQEIMAAGDEQPAEGGVEAAPAISEEEARRGARKGGSGIPTPSDVSAHVRRMEIARQKPKVETDTALPGYMMRAKRLAAKEEGTSLQLKTAIPRGPSPMKGVSRPPRPSTASAIGRSPRK